MRRIAILAVLITGLALPAPSAFAHGNQFICARLAIGDDSQVALELTADHGDNPNIADALEAQQALRECLQVVIGDELFPLEHFAPLSFAEHQHYRVESPVASVNASGPHRLVTAVWRAHLPHGRVAFAAKDRTPLDVLLWRADRRSGTGHSPWVLLIPGDRSPEFTLAMASMRLPAWSVLLLLLAFSPMLWHWWRRPRQPVAAA